VRLSVKHSKRCELRLHYAAKSAKDIWMISACVPALNAIVGVISVFRPSRHPGDRGSPAAAWPQLAFREDVFEFLLCRQPYPVCLQDLAQPLEIDTVARRKNGHNHVFVVGDYHYHLCESFPLSAAPVRSPGPYRLSNACKTGMECVVKSGIG